ncbi:MAG: hypothetical protein PHH14_00360 [Candidatus Margulisbacteria bacterium]|nr:hypothetical protein [Candidatus Margulisiibacteriota bacterium]
MSITPTSNGFGRWLGGGGPRPNSIRQKPALVTIGKGSGVGAICITDQARIFLPPEQSEGDVTLTAQETNGFKEVKVEDKKQWVKVFRFSPFSNSFIQAEELKKTTALLERFQLLSGEIAQSLKEAWSALNASRIPEDRALDLTEQMYGKDPAADETQKETLEECLADLELHKETLIGLEKKIASLDPTFILAELRYFDWRLMIKLFMVWTISLPKLQIEIEALLDAAGQRGIEPEESGR